MSEQQIHFIDGHGVKHKATAPHPDCDHVVVDGVAACPLCNVPKLKVAGVKGTMRTTHDQYIADAGCVECKAVLGTLVVTLSTLFGIEEDERVLQGRCRVY